MKRWTRLTLMLAAVTLVASCSTWRGMPTHGGGKRFDEEQRIVAGAIRRAAADMNLEELRGRTVQIVMDVLSHNGGGYATMPGLQNISGNLSQSMGTNMNEYEPIRIPPPGYYSSYQDSKSFSNSNSYGISGSYQPNMSYSSAQFGTDQDQTYLLAALNMKARHAGLNVVPANGEVLLFVMVDVLGMNRSRRDNLIFWRDKLTATCELTYYAVTAPTNQLLFRARQAKATGTYAEDSLLAFNAFNVERDLQSLPPDFLPVDASLSTQTLAQIEPSTAALAQATPAATLPAGLAKQTGTNDPAQLEFAVSRLRDADLQLRTGNLDLASRNVAAVRAIAPSFPGLVDLELRLAQARELRARSEHAAAARAAAEAAERARQAAPSSAPQKELSAGRF